MNHQLMPAGLEWIQIKTNRNTDEIEKIMSIIPQVGRARFTNQENDLSHLTSSLPSGSIAELVTEDSNIDEIIQHYPSFEGEIPKVNPVTTLGSANDLDIRIEPSPHGIMRD